MGVQRFMGVEARSLENPGTSISSVMMGPSSSAAGVSVTEEAALGLTAYHRAVTLRASVEAMLPIRVYRRDSRDIVQQRTILDSPSPTQTPFEFWQTLKMQQLSWGNGYAFKVRNRAESVQSLRLIHPSRVHVEDDGGIDKVFLVTMKNGREQEFRSWDIFHLPWMSPNGISGLSALQAFRQALGIAIAGDRAAAGFYANGAKLSYLMRVKAKLTKTQSSDLKAQVRELFTGPDRAGEVAVLDSDAELTPLGMPPGDAELLGTRRFSVSEIGRMFGVPSHLLGDQEKSTSWGTGIEQMTIGFATFTLQPSLKATEERITRELLPGGWESGAWEARYDMKGLLRGDATSRAAYYKQMTELQVMDNWDIAKLEDMDTPQRQVFMLPINYAQVDANTGEVTSLAAKPDVPADVVDAVPVPAPSNEGGQQ